jgi:hypothetical protein
MPWPENHLSNRVSSGVMREMAANLERYRRVEDYEKPGIRSPERTRRIDENARVRAAAWRGLAALVDSLERDLGIRDNDSGR